MANPSIKGSAIVSLVEDLRRCIDESRVTFEEVEARLLAEDVALLDTKISPSRWYPVEQYLRLTEMLYQVEGRGLDQAAFQRRRGAGAAERLIQSGIYQQLDYSEVDRGGSPEDLRREIKLRLSLISSMINRGTPHTEFDPDQPARVRIELRDAREVPDLLAHAIAGFLGKCAETRSSKPGSWRAERVAPDVLQFSDRGERD
jgi:hypothetical protein